MIRKGFVIRFCFSLLLFISFVDAEVVEKEDYVLLSAEERLQKNENYGESVPECDCGRNGICQFKVLETNVTRKECICDAGYQELNGTCIRCDCWPNGECSFDKEGNFLKCRCDSGFSENSGKCTFCYCGPKSKCSFRRKRKECTCEQGYKEDEGYCTACDCGPKSQCSFKNKRKVCACARGYIEENGYCTVCDCGPKSKCSVRMNRKVCTCGKGYKEDKGYCKDIDECQNVEACPGPGTLCQNTVGSYKCLCQLGYQERSPNKPGSKALCEKIVLADYAPNYTPWKIGYGVLSAGFIAIIIGLVFIIFRLRK